MAVQNKTITILGSTAAVTSVTLGSAGSKGTGVSVNGTAQDSTGTTVTLIPASIAVLGDPAVDALMARALVLLRKANGLE